MNRLLTKRQYKFFLLALFISLIIGIFFIKKYEWFFQIKDNFERIFSNESFLKIYINENVEYGRSFLDDIKNNFFSTTTNIVTDGVVGAVDYIISFFAFLSNFAIYLQFILLLFIAGGALLILDVQSEINKTKTSACAKFFIKIKKKIVGIITLIINFIKKYKTDLKRITILIVLTVIIYNNGITKFIFETINILVNTFVYFKIYFETNEFVMQGVFSLTYEFIIALVIFIAKIAIINPFILGTISIILFVVFEKYIAHRKQIKNRIEFKKSFYGEVKTIE